MSLNIITAVAKNQKFSMKDLPCDKVVVYQDRAEVKRLIKTKLIKGENELVITNVSTNIDQDSVRVEGLGDATVLDVVCQNKRVIETEDENTNEKVKELKNEIKELETNQEITQLKSERIIKQISVLNDFASNLSNPSASSNGKNNDHVLGSKDNVNNFMSFLDTYSNRLENLDEMKFQVQNELNQIKDKLNVARDNLHRLNISQHSGVNSIEIVILVESKSDDTEVYLYVSYLVNNASWIPKYDIRVFSKDKSMIINYFGMITQSTGEDWNDTKIILSTAVPSIGGNVPELETLNVRIKANERQYFAKSSKFRKTRPIFGTEYYLSDDIALGSSIPTIGVPIRQQIAQVEKSSIGSTSTFEIPRNATIPSDNNTHKVSIGIINLKPEFQYESIPKKNTHAFIKAKVVNESNYLILAGQANAFFENNFVSKTELKSYSPLEEFTCSLGIDSGIRIDYKPIKKFKGQTGLINKSTNTTYVQVIQVKNTTTNAVKILIQDNIPLSNDDKIVVKLLEPVIKNNPIIRLNKLNNIEFDCKIASGKTEELVIKYTIEHLVDQEIDFC